VEGRTLRLTGTAEEQYREWRELLKQLYLEENGGAPATTVKQPDVPAAPGTAPPPAAPVAPEAASQPHANPDKTPETTGQ
jgi:hypothetical protein